NLSAVSDPISENWNEGDLLFFENAREDRRAPHSDVGKVVLAWNDVAIVNIAPLIFAEGDGRAQAGVTQGKGNIVSAVEMLIDQRLQPHVGQNVPAISDERLAAQIGLEVLDSAAGIKKHRLVDQCERSSRIAISRK